MCIVAWGQQAAQTTSAMPTPAMQPLTHGARFGKDILAKRPTLRFVPLRQGDWSVDQVLENWGKRIVFMAADPRLMDGKNVERLALGTVIQPILDRIGGEISGSGISFVHLADGRFGFMRSSELWVAGISIEDEMAEKERRIRQEEEEHAPPVLQSSPVKPSLADSLIPNAQPEAVGKRLWEALLTSCNWTDSEGRSVTSYFHNTREGLIEFRDVTFSKFTSRPITAAERLNGLKAVGYISLSSTVERTMRTPPTKNSPGRWSPFSNGGKMTIKFANWNGKWAFIKNPFFADNTLGESLDASILQTYWNYNPVEDAEHRVSCAVATALDPYAVGAETPLTPRK